MRHVLTAFGLLACGVLAACAHGAQLMRLDPRRELLPDLSSEEAWVLSGASLEPDLGPLGGPAMFLRGPFDQASGQVTVVARAGDAPWQRLTFRAQVQGLAPDQRLVIQVKYRPAGGREPSTPGRWSARDSWKLDVGEWRRVSMDLTPPDGADSITLVLHRTSDRPVLIARPSLTPSWTFSDLAGDIATLDDEATVRMAADVRRVVEDLRGLDYQADVPIRVVDDEQASAYFQDRLERLWPAESRRADEIAYRQLGLWPADLQMLPTLMGLLEEQVGGYYDPERGTFFLLDDMPASSAPILMAHELTHALDDQHFSIGDALEAKTDDDDQAMAYSSVVEGSGTWVMGAYLSRGMEADALSLADLMAIQGTDAGQAEKLMAVPEYLRRSLMAPYVLGSAFLQRGDFSRSSAVQGADIDQAFLEPPTSSEQILHPEKYWDPKRFDPPRPVELPDLAAQLGEGWSLMDSSTLGELLIGLLVGASTPNPNSLVAMAANQWTSSAARGWGGDRWQLYTDGSRHITILCTVWDTEHDAEEFVEALVPLEGRRNYRQGDAVVLVAGLEDGPAQDLAAAVWNTLP